MFRAIFLHEMRYWAKKPAPYLYFLSIFAIAFVSFAGTAGFFDPPKPGAATERLLNSPHELTYMLLYFNKLFLFLLPAIIGATICKDYEYRVHSILYSFPIRKIAYLPGKFLSGWLVVLLITAAAGLGIFLGELLPNLHTNKIGAFRLMGYLQAYGVFIVPNMLICGALIFVASTWFRNVYAGFAGVIFLLLLQIITENAFAHNGWLLAISDPFGQNTVAYLTRFWTLEEQNTRLIPVMGPVLLNRLLWLGIAAAAWGYTYRKFSFSQFALATQGKWRSRKTAISSAPEPLAATDLSEIAFQFGLLQQVKTTWKLARIDLHHLVKSWSFAGMSLAAFTAVLFVLLRVIHTSDMTLLPATRIVLAVPAYFFTGIVILITFVYTGLLVNRERTHGMAQLVGTTPMPGWVFLFAKLLAILMVQALLLLGLMLTGMLIQLFSGYGNLEPGLYLFHLYGLLFPLLAIWALAALFVHTLTSQTYIGLFVLILGWLGAGNLPKVGISSRLFLFNVSDILSYSDLDGYGNEVAPYLLLKGYWLLVSFLLITGAYLLWIRAFPLSLKSRLQEAKTRFTRPVQLLVLGLLAGMGFVGSRIYLAERPLFAAAAARSDSAFASMKATYSRYAQLVQPKIVRMRVNLDLYPQTQRFEARGNYTLHNTSSQAIDTLLVKTGFDEITELKPDRATRSIQSDEQAKYTLIVLRQPLLPDDSLRLHFFIRNTPNTFFERNSGVLVNGTFLRQDIFPRMGYLWEAQSPASADSSAGNRNYQAPDADRIDFACTISTSEEQMAFAPGNVKKTWTDQGRRYFVYQPDQPVKFAFGFQSGQYEVWEEQWQGLTLSIYHHPSHTHNLAAMIAGLKASLAYNTQYFGPYPFTSVRIVEFPQSEGTFATAFVNQLPLSEARFIANPAADTKVNLPFYVPAHELTHHWWGNELLPADAPGALMITESITESLSLHIYERQQGAAQALKFLDLQRERYLRGRTGEQKSEPPLMQVRDEQSYLAYGKGTLAFHTLSHYLGEAQLNQVLKAFLNAYKNQGPPYPTATELVARLKAATPDSLQYLIHDLFETVTFYDNALESATSTRLESGVFRVNLTLAIRKQRVGTAVDSSENERQASLPLADFVEISILDAEGHTLALETHRITQSPQRLSLFVNKVPKQVVLDPHRLLLDKDREDYTLKIEPGPLTGTQETGR